MRPLIQDNINESLNVIIKKLFEGNRIMDRGMSIISVKFAMNNSEKIIHPKLAHLYPLLADKISSYQDARNNLTTYGETFLDNSDYNSPLDFFEKMLDYMMNLEVIVYEAISLSQEERDITTKVFLEKFLLELIPITNQVLLFIDKLEAYGNDGKGLMLFDHNIEDFIIL